MITLTICLIAIIGKLYFWNRYKFDVIKADLWKGAEIMAFAILISLPIDFFLYEQYRKPTALEVYQGKTTLEITYKDGVPVDSVVVYKDK